MQGPQKVLLSEGAPDEYWKLQMAPGTAKGGPQAPPLPQSLKWSDNHDDKL